MIISNQKVLDCARDLIDRLNVRLKNNAGLNTVREALDENGAPLIFISHNASEAEGQPVVLVRMQQVDAVSKDVFGNSLLAYTPSISSLSYELDTHGKPLPAEADLDQIKWELFAFGMRYQLIEIANGSAVTEANSNATSPSLDIDQLYWPTKGV